MLNRSLVIIIFLIILNSCSDPSENSSKDSVFRAGNVTTLSTVIQARTGGLTVDKQGNIYAADFGFNSDSIHKIFKINGYSLATDSIIIPRGAISEYANALPGASGNDFDSNGNLFQAHFFSNSISKIDPNGQVSEFTNEGLNGPVGLVSDANNNLYVCNCNDNTIRKITPVGQSSLFVSDPLLFCPNGITIDPQTGTLYVVNFNNADIIRITSNGIASRFVTLPVGGNGGHITFYEKHLFLTARNSNQIYMVDEKAKIKLFAGDGTLAVVDGPPLQASFALPNGIAVSPDGKYLYTNDVFNEANPQPATPSIIRQIELIRN